MSAIVDLRKKCAQTWDAAKAFLESKRDKDGVVSPEDTAVYEKMEAQVVELGHQIELLERQRDMDDSLSKIVGAPYIPATPGTEGTGTKKTGFASDEYKRDFWDAIRGRKTTNALQVGTDSEGGYLVPDEFDRQLVETLNEQNIFRQLARIIQTASGDHKIPVVATKGTASWVDEEGQISESDNSFSQVTLSAYKLATLIKVSQELLNDSIFPLESYIANEFARRIGAKEEEAFFVGDGTKKPTGVLAATGGAQVGKTTAAATAITLDEILDLYYSLRSPYRAKAVFITNDTTVKTIRKLKDSNGQYLWQPAITASAPDTILGKPIYTSAYVPAIAAAAKTVAFGDFSYYWIADRQGRTFQRLNELYATTGQVGFIATQRVDGKLILPEAVQVLQQAAS